MTVTMIEPSREIQSFLNQKHKLLIGGKRVDAINGEIFEVQNPADNSVIAQVPKGGKEDIDRAVQAARDAFENGPWRRLSVSELKSLRNLRPLTMGNH